MQPDGEISLTAGYFGGYLCNTLSVQILPWVEGAFRYSVLDDLTGDGGTLYDRSFDIKLRLIEEGPPWPAVAFGLQDFLGTGIYSGEYFVATKNLIGGDLKLTGGFGWERFAGTNGVSNPLCFNNNRFCTRDPGSDTGGTVNFGEFFSGEELGFFGGVEWKPPVPGLTVKAEYSDDAYQREKDSGSFSQKIPLNFGLEYRSLGGVELGTYYIYGSEIGVRVTLSGSPFRPIAESDNEPPGRPIHPRPLPDARSAEFGEIRDLPSGTPVTILLADSGVVDLAVEDKPDRLRWATATLPPSADYTCPDQAAKAIDAEHGMVDAVSFRHADGTVLCTVALRSAA